MGGGDVDVLRANVGEVLVERAKSGVRDMGGGDVGVLERSLSLHSLSLDIQSPHI